MKTLIFSLAAGLYLATTGVLARPIDLGEDPARTLAGKDLPAEDARIEKARRWLKQIAEVTGESEEQVAASAMKLARFLYDALKERALPLEALEGMAAQAGAGRSLSDLTSGYFNARRQAADKSHAGAMRLLTGQ
ncbi:MAG: hypothetical protein N3C63_00165 [Rhodocyclaceae bacterium]|nr:hypothetical protein [Rhodocyclaceae bacterium]